jgi:hypothetical protein
MGKASRQKSTPERQKQRFICWCHEIPARYPVRFKSRDTWLDWSDHNREHHNHRPQLGFTEDWVHEDEIGKFIGGQEVILL